MNTTKITIGRLFNLGSYEHIRYEITVEVGEGDSARDALVGLEKILSALAPERNACVDTRSELQREQHRVLELRACLASNSPEEFKRKHGFFEGTPEQYVLRCEEGFKDKMKRREAYEKRAEAARSLLDSVGGASHWKDAKLDWQYEEDI